MRARKIWLSSTGRQDDQATQVPAGTCSKWQSAYPSALNLSGGQTLRLESFGRNFFMLTGCSSRCLQSQMKDGQAACLHRDTGQLCGRGVGQCKVGWVG